MILDAKDVTKSYPQREGPVLDRVSLSIEDGEKAGLIGPSGCGKSTLARILALLESADEGTVTFDGVEASFDSDRLGSHPARRLRRMRPIASAWGGMQMVFQSPQASFPDHMTIGGAIWEGVAYRSGFAHASKRERREMVEEALDSVSLSPSIADKRAFEVSGGECQRAAIARALIGRPRLIICDEATSSLDVTVQARIMGLLERLNRDQGIAFLFITHDLALASSFCDRIYSL